MRAPESATDGDQNTPVQARPVRGTPGETRAAAMQLAIALLTAGLDSPEPEAWAADALIPIDADGLGDFMADLHVISVVLMSEPTSSCRPGLTKLGQTMAMMIEADAAAPAP